MSGQMDPIQTSRLWIARMIILLILIGPGTPLAFAQQSFPSRNESGRYFRIQVVDRQTGRGVPLVELRTVNNIRCFTDSNGIVAFYEPGLMDRDVFFFVESHGYEFPKDGFGFRGISLKTSQGTGAVIKLDRLNIAERLYRVTGQGIYRDSLLTGHSVPLTEPLLNGQVMGQDSVDTCIYHGRLFWLWGDTAKPSYPLGHFAMAGAVSHLPGKGGLDPAIGVNLEYYVDENGFSRPLCRLKEPGLVWLDGLLTVTDEDGRERMVAKYARLKNLGDVYERGLVVFNDSTASFERLTGSGPDCLPYPEPGHAFAVNVDGRQYYYFAVPFPLAVRMRVKARWDCAADPNRYEVLTSLDAGKSADRPEQRLALTTKDKPCRWVSFAELLGNGPSAKASVIEALKAERQDTHLYDIESGREVSPHGGSVYFNAYRHRWVMIFVQQFGDSSFLGETWYAEADTPVGPWVYARKIVTHNKYSFYNPKHHPYFDQDGGRVIFFEGTYSHTFSGSPDNATPRYDYNQIMYRLNLADPRLALPVAVYQVHDGSGEKDYLLRDGVEKGNCWDRVESMPFFAVEPARASADMVPLYAQKIPAGNAQTVSLTATRPDSSAGPLFYAFPPTHPTNENSCVVSLYEYRNTDTGERLYSTGPQLHKAGFIRTENPLCLVWKAPSDALLLDGKAMPSAR